MAFPKNMYGFIALTGGGQGALDAIDGTDLDDQDLATGVVDGKALQYWLDIDSGLAEDPPNVIAPDTNAGDKRWILASIRDFPDELENLTTAEIQQLENIGATTISAAQWGYLGSSSGIDHYVDRGDPSNVDFQIGDFITDGTWHDLDLSSIVPAGAKAVHLWLNIKDDVAGSQFRIRKKGNINDFNRLSQVTQVSDVYISTDSFVSIDSDRKVQYKGDNVTFTNIQITVRGWII